MKEYILEDVAEPNLIKDIFPYSIPPRILFTDNLKEIIDGKEVEINVGSVYKRDIHITDTTFRDGQQARPPYSKEQIIVIYKMLSHLGGPNGIIRQTEFFLYSKKDREAIEACRALGLEYPEITGWIRADKGDFHLVKQMGLKETGMLTSCSDYHIFYKQNQTRKQAMEQYLDVVEKALAEGIRPRCHLEDITRSDIKGFVLPFVQKLERLTENCSENMKVKIRLCDTMGFGLACPNVAEPRSIPKIIWRLREECGISADRLEWHGHNDFHKVLSNGCLAWIYGLNALNTTLFGFGERTGNPPLEGALIEFISLKGDLMGINLPVITEIAEYFQKEIGAEIPDNYPFVGNNFNTTRAGIHAGGLRSNEEIYNIFNTTDLLGRPPKIAITDKSGTDGIVLWINNFLRLKGKKKITAVKAAKIQRWVMDQYEKEGRLTAISDKELEAQVEIHFPDLYRNVKGLMISM
jgi:isopropylmalate/homocitrate/citramalate synthase